MDALQACNRCDPRLREKLCWTCRRDMVLLRGDTLRLLGFSEQIQAVVDATATNE